MLKIVQIGNEMSLVYGLHLKSLKGVFWNTSQSNNDHFSISERCQDVRITLGEGQCLDGEL